LCEFGLFPAQGIGEKALEKRMVFYGSNVLLAIVHLSKKIINNFGSSVIKN
jgi:hypothetical protein